MRQTVKIEIPDHIMRELHYQGGKIVPDILNHLIDSGTVLHNKEFDFHYVIKRWWLERSLILRETIFALDIDIVKGEYNPKETITPLYELPTDLW